MNDLICTDRAKMERVLSGKIYQKLTTKTNVKHVSVKQKHIEKVNKAATFFDRIFEKWPDARIEKGVIILQSKMNYELR